MWSLPGDELPPQAQEGLPSGHARSAFPLVASVIVLATLGLAVAARASLFSHLGLAGMCRNIPDCDIVARSKYAFIAGVPVADIGVGGYLLIAVLGWVVLLSKRYAAAAWRLLYPCTIVGLVISIYLIAMARFQIHALCVWCIASAAVLAVLSIIQAMARLAGTTPGGASVRARFVMAISCAVLVAGASSWLTLDIKARAAEQLSTNRVLRQVPDSELYPQDSYSVGPSSAPVTVVIFGDLQCPGCHDAATKLLDCARKLGTLRVVFRHAPLWAHRASRELAVAAEMAAPYGQFSNLADAANAGMLRSWQACLPWLEGRHIPVSEASVRTARMRVDRDLALSRRLNMKAVPLIILRKGKGLPFVSNEDQACEAASFAIPEPNKP